MLAQIEKQSERLPKQSKAIAEITKHPEEEVRKLNQQESKIEEQIKQLKEERIKQLEKQLAARGVSTSNSPSERKT